jgi:hypothetical protein
VVNPARTAEQAVADECGFAVGPEGRPFAVVGLTVAGGLIVAIDLITDPAKLQRSGY